MTARPAAPARPPAPTGLAGVLTGASYVARGLRVFATTPRIRLLGLVPVLIAGVLVLGLLVVAGLQLDRLAELLTPFADRWSADARDLVRLSVAVTLFLALVAIAVLSFATIATLVGQPFYEAISDRIERALGSPPPTMEIPWWRRIPRAIAESLALLALALSAGAPLFVLGFVPVLGQTVVPVLGAVVGGFFLSLELLAIPLERRGMRLRERLRFVWRHRAMTVGFGVAAFLVFLVPLMNVLALPGAVVGGTLLVRRMTDPAA